MKQNKRVWAAAALLVFLGFLWLCYLCDGVMSRYGIYELFSYQTHELLGLVPFLGLGVTLIWAVVLLVQGFRQKAWRACGPLLAVLLLVSALQAVQLHRELQTVSVTGHITVESMDSRTLTLQARTESGTRLTLDYPMLVGELLKTDGTSYYVSYDLERAYAGRGALTMVWGVQEAR